MPLVDFKDNYFFFYKNIFNNIFLIFFLLYFFIYLKGEGCSRDNYNFYKYIRFFNNYVMIYFPCCYHYVLDKYVGNYD